MGIYIDEERRNVVPAELCTICVGQRYIRALSRDQQTNALRDMTQTPQVRWGNIAQGMQVSRLRSVDELISDTRPLVL